MSGKKQTHPVAANRRSGALGDRWLGQDPPLSSLHVQTEELLTPLFVEHQKVPADRVDADNGAADAHDTWRIRQLADLTPRVDLIEVAALVTTPDDRHFARGIVRRDVVD